MFRLRLIREFYTVEMILEEFKTGVVAGSNAKRGEEDTFYIYIYIYIYVCVCVCVCVDR